MFKQTKHLLAVATNRTALLFDAVTPRERKAYERDHDTRRRHQDIYSDNGDIWLRPLGM